MAFRPTNDRVVVKVNSGPEKIGGIFIPETISEKPTEGKVIAVGPGILKDDGTYTTMEVKPDNQVVFAKQSGTKIKINNEEYLILQECDILGVLE